MKNNFRKKIPFLIFIITIIILFLTVFVLSLIRNKNIDTQQDNWKFDSIELPNIELIDYETTPMLFDFCNGSLGYHFKCNYGEFTNKNFHNFFAILRDNKDEISKNTIFVSYYNVGDKIIFPALGTKIKSYKMNEIERQNFDNWILNLDQNRKFEEDNYSLYIISENINNKNNEYNSCNNIGEYANINLFNLVEFSEDGIMYNKIFEEGKGWPKDWITRDPYKEAILQVQNIDLNDDFWNRFNLYQIVKYNNENYYSDYPYEVEVTVIKTDDFSIINKFGKTIRLREEQLGDLIKHEGWKEKN